MNTDFEDNSPFQEGIISEMYQRPDKSYFQEPQELRSLINTGRIIQKFLLKQADINKILKIIQTKLLRGYLVSSYFKDLYLYLAQNKLPNMKTAIGKVETLAERYTLLDSLLLKIVTTPEKETTLLAIPEICTDKIIMLCHSSLFTGHQAVIKTYQPISDKYFIPGLIHYLHLYIKGYHICQLLHNDKPPTRQLQMRINLNYRPLSRLSMELQVMPRSNKVHKYISCIIDKVTNYLITVLIHQSKSEEIGDAVVEHVITKYFVPDYIIMDQDSAFMSSLLNYLFKKLDISIKTVAPYNHQLLQPEHGIKSLTTILTKHLTILGEMWPKYLPLATFAYNTFNTPT